jgi:hypothetical protein
VGLGIVGVERERAIVARHRLVEPAQMLEGHAKVAMKIRLVALDGDRLSDEIDRHLVTTHLVSEDAKQVQRIGLTGFGGKDLSLETFCVAEPADLVMRQRVAEQSRSRGGRRGGG